MTTVRLLSYSPDYLPTILNAIGQCHGKPVTAKALQHCIDSGHLSVLEHAMASFEIKCSLSVLLQITRHRHLSFTVKSTRVADFDGEFYVPNEIQGEIRQILMGACDDAMSDYNAMVNEETPKEVAAYALPKATMTSFVVSGNLRAWLEYLPKRLCNRALPEHRTVAERIYTELSLAIPEVFDRELVLCGNGCKEKSCIFGGKQ